jgi:hypothetical protein
VALGLQLDLEQGVIKPKYSSARPIMTSLEAGEVARPIMTSLSGILSGILSDLAVFSLLKRKKLQLMFHI